jgi:NitT/TauT family transport system substrate-binding protein
MPMSAAAVPGRHRTSRVRAARIIPAALSAAMLAAGCATSTTAGPGGSAELTSVVVAAVPGEGSAGLYIAADQGLFTKAGLKVTIEPVTSAATVIPAMLRGQVQIAAGQYTTYVAAQASGVARMRLLAAGYSLGPNVQQIMITARSPVRSPAQLNGATIAVNALNSETTDLLYTALAPYSITPRQVHVVAIPFPAMPAALTAHRVTAIYEIEPYATQASQQHGDAELLDIDTAAAQNFPISGYASLSAWAQTHPRPAAAFTRAIEQGNRIASTSLTALQQALETSLHLTPQVADVMATGTFPTAINTALLQRVPDLMLRYGQLPRPFSITTLIRG